MDYLNISISLVGTQSPGVDDGKAESWYESGKIQILLYGIIFIFGLTGNTLVIVTLAKNRQMRTVTNLFLLNLAVSDLLLGLLCMPFTLIGALLRDFIFGEAMCKAIPYLQACSISVGAWTLVAISVERYYAICYPLKSLVWQTISHAYKPILSIWMGSFICMMPIALLSQLKPTNSGNRKCRENWSSEEYEVAYNIFLDVILMVIPLIVLSVAYSLIIRTLWKGIKSERALQHHLNSSVDVYVHLQGNSSYISTKNHHRSTSLPRHYLQRHHQITKNFSDDSNNSLMSSSNGGGSDTRKLTTALRRTNIDRSLRNKKRIIKMLCVVVFEFFICWTPLYVINTIALFDTGLVYRTIGSTGISFFQLLAYTSSCCNPITYCFMNRGFRKNFQKLFKCSSKPNRNFGHVGCSAGGGGSDQMDLKVVNNRVDFA